MTDTVNLFVYGTLRPSNKKPSSTDGALDFSTAIADQIVRTESATLPQAALYNTGTYPAIVPGDSTVHGDLLEVNRSALDITDQIEGHPYFFERKPTTVETASGPAEAWVYWGTETLVKGKPHIQSGDWLRRDVTIDLALAQHVNRFAESKCSWLATVRPDGRAHCAPMWHAWYRGRVYLVAQPTSIKMANIAANPSVSITHPDPSDVIIIEGEAAEAPHMADAIKPIMKAKYDWDITTESEYCTVIEITPTKLMTWNNSPVQRWNTEEILQVW